jgi:phenylpropionate dioxygenase-like ring-hydroxylating dioxygenase large terminal subunit
LLLNGDGNCKKIRCPFHCWTYDLDGGLIFAPRMEGVSDFDFGAYGLMEFRVGVVDGFVFVSLDSAAGELDEWLGDYSSLHAAWGLDQWVTTRVREFEVRCNWKAFLEVFNEYYHLPYVHPTSINRMYPEPDDADQVIGNFTTQFGKTEGNAALLSGAQDQAFPDAANLVGRERNGTRYTWVYPNMTFAASSDSLWTYEAYPVTPNRSRIVQTVCFPAETAASEGFESCAKHYYERIDTAIAEDIPFLEQQHIGLSSPLAKQGRFSSLEPSVANFACWYAGQLFKIIG